MVPSTALHWPALAWVQPSSVVPSNMETRFGSPYGLSTLGGTACGATDAVAIGTVTAATARATPAAASAHIVRRSMAVLLAVRGRGRLTGGLWGARPSVNR